MFGITSSGGSKTEAFLKRLTQRDHLSELDKYGQLGVNALAAATPVETGLAAHSWRYRIIPGRRPTIEWYNTDRESGVTVVILIQYGHATGTGGYVAGRDFINPAMRPIFDKIADDVWRKVVKS